MKQYLLKVWMTAALSLLALGGVWGQTAATVVSLSPADGAIGVSLDGVLSVTFDQNIEFGSGPSYVWVRDYASGDPVVECVVIDSKAFGNVSISGSTLSIAHSALSGSTRYYVEIGANAIRALNSGLSYAGLGDKDIWDFTTLALPLELSIESLNPANDATEVSLDGVLSVTFDQNIEFGSGPSYIRIKDYVTDDSVIECVVMDSKAFGNVSISGSTLSIAHSALSGSTRYYVEIQNGAIQGTNNGPVFAGLPDKDAWDFTTKEAPFTLDLQVPEDGASDVALNASLVATFNQIIQLKSGAEVYIYDYLSESLVETITTGLSVSDGDLIINPTTDLTEGTHYYVVIPNGAVETTSGAAFAGLSDKDAWDFTTVYLPLENPVLSPAHKADGVLKDVVLSLQFDKDIELGSGMIGIYNGATQEKLFDASSAAVSIVNNNTLQIDLSSNPLPEYGAVYDVRIASTLIKRVGSEVYFAGFGAGEWSFTTEVEPEPLRMLYSSPEHGDVEVSRAPTLQVSFDQEIIWGPSGVLTIHRSDNNDTVATISREQTGASISQYQLSIVFSSESLEYGTEYYVIIDEGFVKALNTSAVFAGLSGKTDWTFTTETAPPFWAEEEGYPMIANQTAADFDLLGKVDQDGTYYFVVSDKDAMLTYEEISTAATSGGTGRFLAAGNGVVADTEFEATISTADLEPGFNYYLFVYTSNGDKNGEIVRLTIDRTAPKLRTTGTFPSAGYSVLPIDADIVLTFSEKIYGVEGGELVELTTANAGSFIKLVTGETSVTTGISVSEDGRVFTLSPTDDLSENTSYSVEFSELSDAQFNVATIPAHTFSTDGLNEWTGLGATVNWSDAGNWYGGYAAGKSVIIPSNSLGNYPVISSDVEVNNLTINPGAALTHIGGELTVSGEFILKSSVDVNASYINSGVEGVNLYVDGDKVRVEQIFEDVYLTYLLSSPTAKTNVANFGGYFPLYLYDNATDTWPAVTFSDPMQAGVGYRMWTDDPIVFFSGEFNTGGVQVPLTYTNGKGYGWNLVGNPYSASIDWTLLKVIENSQNIEDNFWVWMPTQRAYGAYSASTTIPLNIESSIIPSNHAFLVKVISPEEEAYINFDPSAQLVNSNNYLKAGSTYSTSYVKLAGVFGNVKDEMAVAFIDDASMGLDRYDMEKRFANQKHVFELFTNISNLQAAINAIPLEESVEVPLGYNAMVAGDFSIEMVKDNTENVSCILVDKSLEIEQVLRPGDRYEFSAAKGKNITRFALKFSKIVTSERDIERPVADFSCHVLDSEIFVDFDNAHDGIRFQVADVQGRILKQGSILDSSKFSVGAYEQGVYVLTFIDLNGQWYGSQKVVVY